MTAAPARYLCLGSARIPFPLPNGTLDENILNLTANFAQLRFTQVLETDAVVVKGGAEIEYPVLIPSKHKG